MFVVVECDSTGATVTHGPNGVNPEPRLGLPARLPNRRLAVPILMYHRNNVAPPGTPAMERRLSVGPADFARQMSLARPERLSHGHAA